MAGQHVQTEVVDNPRAARFEAHDGGRVAGHVSYQHEQGTLVLIHTEVDPSYEGKGVGSALAAGALSAVRDRGLRVVPRCPFIAGYIRRHPEYTDLVAGG